MTCVLPCGKAQWLTNTQKGSRKFSSGCGLENKWEAGVSKERKCGYGENVSGRAKSW